MVFSPFTAIHARAIGWHNHARNIIADRVANGVVFDVVRCGAAIGILRGSCPAGRTMDTRRKPHRLQNWEPLDFLSLQQDLRSCGFTPSDKDVAAALHLALEWHESSLGHFPTGKLIGALLGLTLVEKYDEGWAKAPPFEAIDEPPMARDMRRREKRRVAQIARRRASGVKDATKSEAKAQPWVVLGMSRRTYYRNKAKLKDGTEMKPSIIIIQGFKTVSSEAEQ